MDVGPVGLERGRRIGNGDGLCRGGRRQLGVHAHHFIPVD